MLSLAAYVDAARTQLKAPRARRYGILTRIVGLALLSDPFAEFSSQTASMSTHRWLVLNPARCF